MTMVSDILCNVGILKINTAHLFKSNFENAMRGNFTTLLTLTS